MINTIDKTMEESLFKYGRFVVQKMINKLEEGDGKRKGIKGSRFVGTLIRNKTLSGKPVIEIDTQTGIVELIFNMDDYGLYIDKGRGPNKPLPPVKPLQEWMSRHNMKPENPKDTQLFGLRKHIAENGIEPLPFLDIWANSVKGLTRILEQESIKTIKIELGKIIKKTNK